MRIRELRLINAANEQVGVVNSRDALDQAKEAGLDLVLVAPNAEPPVAKIVDYGKWKYEQDKLKKDQKRKTQEVKGIKISLNIAEHDLMVSARKAIGFLKEGDKVRLVCRFRQRELAYAHLGRAKIEELATALEEFGKRERDPILNGREMVMVINPKPAGKVKKENAKAEDEEDGSEAV